METVTDYEDTLDWLLTHLKTAYNVTVDDPEADIDTYGLDSVEKVSICAELSQYLGRTIDPDILLDCENYADVVLTALGTPARRQVAATLHNKTPSTTRAQHSYAEYVNPQLAGKMAKIRLDKRFVKGQGSYLYDEDDNCYLDFMAQFGALPFGHNPQSIWNALLAVQARSEPNFVQPSLLDAAGELAQQLLAYAPDNLQYVTFANSGAEAVEAAIKLARSATQRSAVLSTRGGFHGKTMGALSISGKPDYQKPFNLNFNDFDHIPFNDLTALASCLQNNPQRYAAFIVEPIQGEAGVIIPADDYIKQAQDLCRRFNVLFVLDEVQTGLGRTGDVFMATALQVQPDILVTAKALGGGLFPVGAVLSSGAVYTDKFALKHSSTFAGNTLAARAGLATLAMLSSDNAAVLQNVKTHGRYLLNELQQCQIRYPQIIKQVRGRGFLIGVELQVDETLGVFNFISVASRVNELAQFFASYMLNVEHVRVVPTLNCGNVIRIQPPLTATLADCQAFIAAFEHTAAVFATANTGHIYQSILSGRRKPFPVNDKTAPDYNPVQFNSGNKFAFLLHPLDDESYRHFDNSLDQLDADEMAEFASTMDGLVDVYAASEVVIRSDKSTAKADFILVNHSAKRLKAMARREAVAILKEAVALAKKRGNQLVGLGAYTSIISDGGLALKDEAIPLTSGNAYTVVSALQSLALVMERLSWRSADCCVAVVGAAGSIGRALSILVAETTGSLVLLGNAARGEQAGRQQLMAIAAEICCHLCEQLQQGIVFAGNTLAAHLQALPDVPQTFDTIDAFIPVAQWLEQRGALVITVNPEDLQQADVVLTATSFPGSSFNYDNLKTNAVVCDISRPRSVSEEIKHSRPDVIVVDGGVVSVPGAPDLTAYGLPCGHSYACMAETMILALAGEFQAAPLGPKLDLSYIRKIQALGEQHGFRTSSVQSFGKVFTLDDDVSTGT